MRGVRKRALLGSCPCLSSSLASSGRRPALLATRHNEPLRERDGNRGDGIFARAVEIDAGNVGYLDVTAVGVFSEAFSCGPIPLAAA